MRANGHNSSSEKIRCISSNRFNACINFRQCNSQFRYVNCAWRKKNIIINLASINGYMRYGKLDRRF